MPKNYTEEDLSRAVSAVKRNQLTVTQAAKEYGLPRTTLTDHVKNPETRTKKGPQKQLTKEESDGLVAFVLYMAGHGFPMTRLMVRCYVQEIVRRSGRTTLFNLEKGPSDEWFRKLKADYPQLAFRKPENRDRGRSRMSNKKVVNDFFQFWSDTLQKHGLLDKPSQVYNCDETGWSGKETARGKVIGPRTGHVFQQKVMTADHLTAHLCVSADGIYIPTMVIFKGGMPHRNYKDGLPGS
ncbi:uncharacterized protein LOC128558830 [Mercenaria mercenaria]|uniref:uncharacterized protein LOC128558830 n=1 Tax=Mercenaria mercenaria TaxID=6596 RepID=UPI00234F8075|nr:uncharacterized protein LOC128558830 [Mercenaria mercenaria]